MDTTWSPSTKDKVSLKVYYSSFISEFTRTLQSLGLPCIDSLSTLNEQIYRGLYPPVLSFADIGISIITPPGVTAMILREGYSLGARNFFLQPGTYDEEVDRIIRLEVHEAVCIKGCVLVDLGFQDEEPW